MFNPTLSPVDRALWAEAKTKHLQTVGEDSYGYSPPTPPLLPQTIYFFEAKNSDNLMSATIDGPDSDECVFS